MESTEIAITLIAGTLNPILVHYLISLYSNLISDIDEMTKKRADFIKRTIAGVTLLATGVLVLFIQYDAGLITSASSAITSFIIYAFASQGAYDIVYSRVFTDKKPKT